MATKPYHHGDLRTAMIEKGIELINEGGMDALSLRKVAAACGVSHSAPYAHFANKEELLDTIRGYVLGKLATALKGAVHNAAPTPTGLHRLGCAYVLFFADSPHYYHFVFSGSSGIYAGDGHVNEPYDFFVGYLHQVFDAIDYPQELRLKAALTQWALMHGLAAMAVMTKFGRSWSWKENVSNMLSKKFLIFEENDNV